MSLNEDAQSFKTKRLWHFSHQVFPKPGEHPKVATKPKYFIPRHNTFSVFKKTQTHYFCIPPNLPVKEKILCCPSVIAEPHPQLQFQELKIKATVWGASAMIFK